MVDFYQNIRPASFRGIPFETTEDSSGFGRRVHTHEYPNKDTPVHEDSGMAVQSFSFTAVIRGVEYYSRASGFEKALIKSGAGKLVHPYYGEIDVVVKRVNRVHSSDRIGEVIFRVDFEKYGAPIYPQPAVDTSSNIKITSDAFFTNVEADFISKFTSTGIPDFITNDAVERINSFTDNIKSVIKISSFQPAIAWPNNWDIGNTKDLASSLIDLYQTIAGTVEKNNTPVIGGALNIKNTLPSDPITLAQSLIKSTDYSVALSGINNTSSGAVRTKNASALDLIQRSSASSAGGQALRQVSYESQEQAIFIRDLFADKMDILLNDLGEAGWDNSWSTAHNLNAAVIQDINVQIGRLPKTVKIQNSTLRPAITLANRLYGDDPTVLFKKTADIVVRNSVRHPSFVPATELEVLI